MKSNINFLTSLSLLFLLLFSPLCSKAQFGAPPIGETSCVANCASDTSSEPASTPDPTPTTETTEDPTPSAPETTEDTTPSTPQTIATSLETTVELDQQIIQKLKAKDYAACPPLINTAIVSLTDVRINLETDSESQELCKNIPKAISLINKSIKKHEKAASSIDLILNDPRVSEIKKAIIKFGKKAKRFLNGGRRNTSRTFAICGIRG